VTSADYFRTQAIKVSGNHRLSGETILAQAQLRPGENLLAINLHLVRHRLLAHPWIAEARVVREIPETLIIEVVERQALAVIDLGRRFLLDADGRVFKKYESDDRLELPVVNGIDYTDISLGNDQLGPALKAIVAVLSGNSKALEQNGVAKVHYDAEMGITLTERNTARQIKLGLDRFDEKFVRLEQLHRHLGSSGRWEAVKAIDLNHPDRVVAKIEAAAPPSK
jgi:cell division protein FtsQ